MFINSLQPNCPTHVFTLFLFQLLVHNMIFYPNLFFNDFALKIKKNYCKLIEADAYLKHSSKINRLYFIV